MTSPIPRSVWSVASLEWLRPLGSTQRLPPGAPLSHDGCAYRYWNRVSSSPTEHWQQAGSFSPVILLSRRPSLRQETLLPNVTTNKARDFYSSPSSLERLTDLPHDMGGKESFYGSIIKNKDDDLSPELIAWEQQCHALFALLAQKRFVSTDGLRRAIEALAPDQYASWSYYEKWSAAMTSLLLERGTISQQELERALFGDVCGAGGRGSDGEDDEQTLPPLYRTGEAVRVREFHPRGGVEWRRPHIRTPGYVYGVAGTIERVCGRHGDPSFLAFGLRAPNVQLYRVRFRSRDIWPERFRHGSVVSNSDKSSTADEEEGDVVEVEVYEHWLEPAKVSTGHNFEDRELFNHGSGDDCLASHHHSHDLSGGHADEGVGGGEHTHERRSVVEERAVRLEGPPRPGKELHQALVALLLDKGVVTAEELRAMCERMDTAGKRLDGASLVVRAWLDPSFESRLLSDSASAASEMGISTSNPNAPTVLTVMKNTDTTHNLVVCTLCSCYPSGLLGIAPSWYKSREYRSRAVREPRVVLRDEFGLDISQGKSIRVHDSTADHRYLVLPERPAGTEDWSEESLRSLVTRDTMIGVAVPCTS